MTERLRIFKVVGVFIGIILGAGFASGQELLQFFVRFGDYAFWGLAVAGVIFFITGWAVLQICYRLRIQSYSEFIRYVMGEMGGMVMETVVLCFMFVIFATMLAGGGAAMQTQFAMPYSTAVVLVAVFCFITFLFDLEGFIELNAVLSPVLLIGGMIVGIYSLVTQTEPTFSFAFMKPTENWFWAAVMYASYNMITAISLLTTLGPLVSTKRVAFYGTLLGSLAMTLMGVCLSLPLLNEYADIQGKEIPLLAILSDSGVLMQYFYFFVLLVAIFTTAVANGFAVLQSFRETTLFHKHPVFLKLLVCIAGAGFAHIGFSTFVGSVYPLFGYIGLLEILFLLFAFAKTLHRTRERKPLDYPHKK